MHHLNPGADAGPGDHGADAYSATGRAVHAPGPFAGSGAAAAPPAVDPRVREARRAAEWSDVRAAAILTLVLLAVSAALGVLWAHLAPPGPLAVVWNDKHQLVVDETEAYIAGDARFAIIGVATGVVAGLVTWFFRPLRSLYAAIALAVGGLGGAYLMSLVGYYTRGTVNLDKAPGTVLKHAPLMVHIRGFLFLEAVAALLVYLLIVAFASRDDLGRPDPAAAPESLGSPDPASAGASR